MGVNRGVHLERARKKNYKIPIEKRLLLRRFIGPLFASCQNVDVTFEINARSEPKSRIEKGNCNESRKAVFADYQEDRNGRAISRRAALRETILSASSPDLREKNCACNAALRQSRRSVIGDLSRSSCRRSAATRARLLTAILVEIPRRSRNRRARNAISLLGLHVIRGIFTRISRDDLAPICNTTRPRNGG